MKPNKVTKRLSITKTTVAHLHDGDLQNVKAGNVATCTMDIGCWTRLDSSCEH